MLLYPAALSGMADLARHRPAVVRVLVVDDYEPFRRFVCTTLERKPEFRLIGIALDGLEAVQKAEELQPDLILLDIGLPRLKGLEAALRITRLVPSATILFISQNKDPDVVAEAIGKGAGGFVRKQHANKELLPAIEAALRGDHFVSEGLMSES